MDDSQKRKSRLELGHVLFIDIAGYSKLTTEEESEALPELTLRRLSSATNDGLSLMALGPRWAAPALSISGRARRSAGHPYN